MPLKQKTVLVDPYHAARLNMVRGQVMPNKVTNPRVLQTLASVPRERFVAPRYQGVAYMDEDIEIAAGRYLLEPVVFARLIQLAEVSPESTVLDLAPATGYSTAVLAHLANAVYAVEEDPTLAEQAADTLEALGLTNAHMHVGAHQDGLPGHAPYDIIFIGGLVDSIPANILDQLAPNGRLLAVRRIDGIGRAVVIQRHSRGFAEHEVFDAAVHPTPGFTSKARFVL